MPTECSAKEIDFGRAGARRVVADFRRRDVFLGRRALLLGEADKAIRLIDRFAACFRDARHPADVLHDVRKLPPATRVWRRASGRGCSRPGDCRRQRVESRRACSGIPVVDKGLRVAPLPRDRQDRRTAGKPTRVFS
jgi:hypothetical protein